MIRRFSCRFEADGANRKSEAIFSATLHAAIAANPFLLFHALATTSGVFIFSWEGDNVFAQTERAILAVT